MLEYAKTILKKVSFDARLFEKELRKAIKMLVKEELHELKLWCYATFSDRYAGILKKVF